MTCSRWWGRCCKRSSTLLLRPCFDAMDPIRITERGVSAKPRARARRYRFRRDPTDTSAGAMNLFGVAPRGVSCTKLAALHQRGDATVAASGRSHPYNLGRVAGTTRVQHSGDMVGQQFKWLNAVSGQPQGPGVRQEEDSESLSSCPQRQNDHRPSPCGSQGLCAHEARARRVTGGVARADVSYERGQSRDLIQRQREQVAGQRSECADHPRTIGFLDHETGRIHLGSITHPMEGLTHEVMATDKPRDGHGGLSSSLPSGISYV